MKKASKSKRITGETDYIKTHKLKKAADSHAAKIRKGGGKVSRKKVKNGYQLNYTY